MIRRLRDLATLRIVRVTWPYPALELVRPDGRGWLLLPLNYRTKDDR
ncbi:hypothetical protein ACIRRH_41305 [Kitasatospora sp. NPDC101235]